MIIIPRTSLLFFFFFFGIYLFYFIKKIFLGVPVVAQWLTDPTRNHEVAGLIPGLAQWANDLALP